MKISEFANKFDVTNDTVRYYMKLNLIVPEKRGGHYYFNEDCHRDMEAILKLKQMEFTLDEIKEIFNYQRIGKLTSYQRHAYYRELYTAKVQELQKRIAQLTKAQGELEEKIADLATTTADHKVTMGIDLMTLSLFACPNCQLDLLLTAEHVEANQVLEGSLHCQCGYKLLIKNGILHAENLDTATDEDQIEDDHIEKYIKSTNSEFMDEFYQSLERIQRQISVDDLAGKIILEPGSGYGHFLRRIYDRLSDDSIYICIDHNPRLNHYLKRLLEMTGKKGKVIFITADLAELPLKEGIVDLVIDFSGTSNYAFENSAFLPQLLDRYLQKDATIYAAFILYHKFGPNTIVPAPCRGNFNYTNVRNGLLDLDLSLEDEHTSQVLEIAKSMGEYEDFAQPGDQIFGYQVKATKRWS